MRLSRPLRFPFVITWMMLAIFIWITYKLHGQFMQEGTPTRIMNDLPQTEHLRKIGSTDSSTAAAYSRTKNNSSFSACLLVMDDNHFLIEWLAFHFFTLPLSRVILAVDPRSETSPSKILNRWKGRMTTDLWQDEDYMNSEELDQAEHYVRKFFKITDQPELVRHRARQRLFYYKCMKQLKQEERRWVTLIDTDEFLTINAKTAARLNLTIPTIDRPGSVMSFLQKELQRPGNNLSAACIQIPRLRFGTVESNANQVQRRVPPGFNASHFQTLRWRRHAAPRNQQFNKISKAIVDVSRVDPDMLAPVDSIHRPIMGLCGHRRLYIKHQDQVFVIHHYLGSREQYFYRKDSRLGNERSEQVFQRTATLDEIPIGNDDLRLWLRGFVRTHGYNVTLSLLDGIGMLDSKPGG